MYRLLAGTSLCIALAASVHLLHHSAHAQQFADWKGAQTGWDGRLVTRTCHAAADDLPALKATLLEHEKVLIGFRNKMFHGVLTYGDLSGGRIRTAEPRSLLKKITGNLARLKDGGETAALLYDVGLSNQHYALCVWLITAQGIEAAETVPIPAESALRRSSAATLLRSGLRVEARAARRTLRACASEPVEDEEDAPDDRAATPEGMMNETWKLLLPPPVAAKLDASGAKRLLVLPVTDIGSVPFAALPIGGRQLIDRFALVLLPDVEGLLGIVPPPTRWWNDGRNSLVIGDPDLPRWRNRCFQPLPGARSEALEVAAMAGAKPLLGPEATKTEVLRRLNSDPFLGLIPPFQKFDSCCV